MIPLQASNTQTDQTSQSAGQKTGTGAGASGGLHGNQINVAFPGASIATDAAGSPGGIPTWVYVLVAAAGLVFWYVAKKHR